MPFTPINIGAAPNDGTGDTARVAFDKINTMFQELFSSQGGIIGEQFSQVAHPFGDNDPVYRTAAGEWAAADAADATQPESDAAGIVRVIDQDNFYVYYFGPLDGFVALTPGQVSFLQVGGGLATTPPSGIGEAVLPMVYALTSTRGLVLSRTGFSSDAEPA